MYLYKVGTRPDVLRFQRCLLRGVPLHSVVVPLFTIPTAVSSIVHMCYTGTVQSCL